MFFIICFIVWFDETKQKIPTRLDRVVKCCLGILWGLENTRHEVARWQKILSCQVAQLGCQDLHLGSRIKYKSSQKSHQGVLLIKEIWPATQHRDEKNWHNPSWNESLRSYKILRPCTIWRSAFKDHLDKSNLQKR